MKRGESVIFFVFAFLILNLNIVGAIESYANSSLKQTYNSGDAISGYIRLNLYNESYESLVGSNLNGTIKLGELINKNGLKNGVDYSCSNLNCSSQYIIQSPVDTVQITSGQSNELGFKVSGSNVRIQDISFVLSGTDSPSCSNQVGTDILDSEEHIIQNNKYTLETCSVRVSGCFNSSLATPYYSRANISSIPYCIKQKLPPAPAYQLGAHILSPNNLTNDTFIMSLYPSDFSTSPLANCILPNVTQNNGETYCTAEYGSNKEQEYYICLYSNKASSAYTIKTEQSEPTCGTRAPEAVNKQIDFDIFAQPLKYDTPNIEFNSELFNSIYFRENFSNIVQKYIIDKYNGDCIMNNCIIPLNIHGNTQTITLSSASIAYTSGGIPFTDNNIYLVKKENSKLSGNNLLINLALSNMLISYGSQPNKFILYLNNKTLMTVPINVTLGSYFDIYPKIALIGIPTEFKISSVQNVSFASWTFGDSQTVSGGTSVIHTFNQPGNYNVLVQITTLDGKTSSRNLNILVGQAQASVNDLIQINRDRINNLNANISIFPDWTQNDIRNKLNITNLNYSLENIVNKLNYATNDSEYVDGLTEISSLDIPSLLSITKTGTFPLALFYKNADLGAINQLSGNVSSNSETTKSRLLVWLDDNYDAQLKSDTISVRREGSQEDLSTIVELNLDSKNVGSLDSPRYLIINYPNEAIKYKEQYGQKPISGASYIPLKEGNNKIEFMIMDKINIQNIGIYVSPQLSKLSSSVEDIPLVIDNSKNKIRNLIIAYIFYAIIICFVAFIIQYWYKKRYENFLFKKADDLFNVMTFIFNSRNSGINDKEIKKKLLSNGWKSEQISYAFDKLSGKVLGIFGIPIFKAIQEKNVTELIKKRQNGGVTRFIKR